MYSIFSRKKRLSQMELQHASSPQYVCQSGGINTKHKMMQCTVLNSFFLKTKASKIRVYATTNT